jgi:hypothetical protein
MRNNYNKQLYYWKVVAVTTKHIGISRIPNRQISGAISAAVKFIRDIKFFLEDRCIVTVYDENIEGKSWKSFSPIAIKQIIAGKVNRSLKPGKQSEALRDLHPFDVVDWVDGNLIVESDNKIFVVSPFGYILNLNGMS